MIVTTRKISESPLFEGACPTCNGVGKVLTVPQYSNHEPWEQECSNCFGETRISDALNLRKEKGSQLRQMMIDKHLTIREAVQKFGGYMTDWVDAKQGRASLKDILLKVDKVSVLPNVRG